VDRLNSSHSFHPYAHDILFAYNLLHKFNGIIFRFCYLFGNYCVAFSSQCLSLIEPHHFNFSFKIVIADSSVKLSKHACRRHDWLVGFSLPTSILYLNLLKKLNPFKQISSFVRHIPCICYLDYKTPCHWTGKAISVWLSFQISQMR